MTAQELIDELKEYPADLEIYLSNGMMNGDNEMLIWKIRGIFDTKDEECGHEICIAFE